MKYLSIWEQPDEVLDFLTKWDFITPDEAANDYDLLRSVEGIEDVEVSKPNDCGIVTVSHTPTSAIAYAIGLAISSSFKSE